MARAGVILSIRISRPRHDDDILRCYMLPLAPALTSFSFGRLIRSALPRSVAKADFFRAAARRRADDGFSAGCWPELERFSAGRRLCSAWKPRLLSPWRQ